MQVWDMLSCQYINSDVLDEFGAYFLGGLYSPDDGDLP